MEQQRNHMSGYSSLPLRAVGIMVGTSTTDFTVLPADYFRHILTGTKIQCKWMRVQNIFHNLLTFQLKSAILSTKILKSDFFGKYFYFPRQQGGDIPLFGAE